MSEQAPQSDLAGPVLRVAALPGGLDVVCGLSSPAEQGLEGGAERVPSSVTESSTRAAPAQPLVVRDPLHEPVAVQARQRVVEELGADLVGARVQLAEAQRLTRLIEHAEHGWRSPAPHEQLQQQRDRLRIDLHPPTGLATRAPLPPPKTCTATRPAVHVCNSAAVPVLSAVRTAAQYPLELGVALPVEQLLEL